MGRDGDDMLSKMLSVPDSQRPTELPAPPGNQETSVPEDALPVVDNLLSWTQSQRPARRVVIAGVLTHLKLSCLCLHQPSRPMPTLLVNRKLIPAVKGDHEFGTNLLFS